MALGAALAEVVDAAIGRHWYDVTARPGTNIYVWWSPEAEKWNVRDIAGAHVALAFTDPTDPQGAIRVAVATLDADGTLPA